MAMNKNDNELFADRVNNFLSSNRKVILGLIAMLVIVIVGLTVYFSFVAKKKADDIASIEKIIFDLNKAKEDIEKEKEEAKKDEEKKKEEQAESGETVEPNPSISEKLEAKEETTSEEGKKEDEKSSEKEEEVITDPQILEKEDVAIKELEELGRNASGYASYLAFYNIADIYFGRKKYAEAKEYYTKASDAVPNSYVLGVLYFNTAVCMEELAESDDSILEYYKKASEVEDFPLKPRAMFNMARMQEKMGKNEEAVAIYKDILEKYPENDFALIGKTRIIALEIKK